MPTQITCTCGLWRTLTSSHASRVWRPLAPIRDQSGARRLGSHSGASPSQTSKARVSTIFKGVFICDSNCLILFPSVAFVKRSASISAVCFLRSLTRPSCTKSCTHKKAVSMCLTLPSPRRLPMAMPLDASIRMVMGQLMPQSLSMDCSPNDELAALTSPQNSASALESAMTTWPLHPVSITLDPSMVTEPLVDPSVVSV